MVRDRELALWAWVSQLMEKERMAEEMERMARVHQWVETHAAVSHPSGVGAHALEVEAHAIHPKGYQLVDAVHGKKSRCCCCCCF